MSLSESVSLSENFTYDTGLAGTTPALAVGLMGVGMGISLGLNLLICLRQCNCLKNLSGFRNYTLNRI